MAHTIDTDAKVIAGDDYGFGHPSICRLSTTIMLAGHINESNELEIHKSTNDGVNWTLKKTLTNASTFFQLIPMTSTKAALVYLKNANEFEVWITTDAGENWTNKLDITIGVDSNDKAVLLYNIALGRLYIFSHMQVADGYTYNQYSDDDGDTWTGTQQGSFGVSETVDGDINVINNEIYVSYFLANPASNWAVRFNSIGGYLAYFNYGSANNTYHDKNFAIDSQGNRYFTYVRKDTSNWEYFQVHKNEGTQTTLFNTGAPGTLIVKGSSSIGIDEDDNVYLYYTKNSDEKTYYRKYDALTSTWETEVELITVVNNRINTEKHVLGGSDKLHFVYYKQP